MRPTGICMFRTVGTCTSTTLPCKVGHAKIGGWADTVSSKTAPTHAPFKNTGDWRYPNNDGIDPDSSINVTILNTYINVGMILSDGRA